MPEIGNKVRIIIDRITYIGIVDSIATNPITKETLFIIEIPRLSEFRTCLETEFEPYTHPHIGNTFSKDYNEER